MQITRNLVHLAFVCLFAVQTKGGSLPFEGLTDIQGPFDGVGIDGDAFYCRKLGSVGNWPIWAFWSSAKVHGSSVLGHGWCVPAFESKFVQLDERRWEFFQPDGYRRIFVQTSKSKEGILTGGRAWRAELGGNGRVIVVADPEDGGIPSKFEFQHGKLVRMACEEGDFTIRYDGKHVKQILSRGQTLLEVVRKSRPDRHVELNFKESGIQVARFRMAPVYVNRGKGVTLRVEQRFCLTELAGAAGEKAVFSYGIESGEPFFAADGIRRTWDPETGFIKSYRGWMYDIGVPSYEGGEPAFSRDHTDGRREVYHYDRRNGLLSRLFADGSSRKSQMFTSGPFAYRRTRWVRDVNRDGTCRHTEFTYDKNGRLYYRSTTSNEGEAEVKTEFWFSADGKVTRKRVDGKEVPST
jgi:hypothetical protein